MVIIPYIGGKRFCVLALCGWVTATGFCPADDLDLPVPLGYVDGTPSVGQSERVGLDAVSDPVAEEPAGQDVEPMPQPHAENTKSGEALQSEEAPRDPVSPEPARLLDVATVTQMALENSGLPRRHAAASAFLAAEADTVNRIPDPQLRGQYGTRRRGDDDASVTGDARDTTRSAEVAVRFYVPNAYAGNSSRRATLAERDAEDAAWLRERWTLFCDVRQLLLDVLYYEKRLVLLEQRVELACHNQERINALKNAGEVTAFDSIDDNLDYLREMRERDEVQRELTCVSGRLILLTGIEQPQDWRLAFQRMDQVVRLDHFAELDSLLEMADTSRPEVQQAENQLRAAQWKLSAERRKSLPWIDFFQVGYEQNDLDNRDDTTWSVQAGLNLPLVSAVSSSKRRVARAEIEQAEAELVSARQQIEREVKEAVFRLHTALKSRINIRDRVDPVIGQAEKMIDDAAHEAGYDEFELNGFKRRLLDARMVQLDAEYVLRSSMLNLERAIGADI
jgi:outer membrane protein TolC